MQFFYWPLAKAVKILEGRINHHNYTASPTQDNFETILSLSLLFE